MSGRHVLQFRPRGSSEAMPYSPQRDLATLYVPAMREAVLGLDEVNWRPFFGDWMDSCGLTAEMLGEGVKLFVQAHQLFTGHPEITSPNDAFVKSGFDALSPAVKAAIYFRLGEVIAAGFFVALRDVTMQGDVPPNMDEIALMVVAGRRMAERLTGTLKRSPDAKEELEEKLAAAELETEEQRVARSKVWDMVHKGDAANRILSDKLHAALCEHRSEVSRLQNRTLWQTLRDWWVWRMPKQIAPSATS